MLEALLSLMALACIEPTPPSLPFPSGLSRTASLSCRCTCWHPRHDAKGWPFVFVQDGLVRAQAQKTRFHIDHEV